MTERTIADLVGHTVAGFGVRRCFGVVGSGNFHVTNALRAAGVEFVAARHECNAVTMADAHARLTGELTAASVHPGPGLTNAMTGITEAAKSRSPLLVLAGDTANGALRSNFHIDQTQVVRAVGAVAERLHSPATAAADVVRAAERAVRERRTVVLNLPLDVQAATVPVGVTVPAARLNTARVRPDPAAVAAAADALAAAERPLLVAGHGAVLSGAREALLELGDLLGALLATSARAHGYFAGHPWSLGISGGFSSPAAVEAIGESDVVVGFGATFTQWTTRHGSLLRDASIVIQVDTDIERLGSQRHVDLEICGDAAASAAALVRALRERGVDGRVGRRTPQTAARLMAGANNAVSYEDASTPEYIDPRTLTKKLDELLPEQRTVVLDSGHFMGWPARHLRVPDEQGWVFTQAFQSVGLGLASAIGAAVARPDRLTVAALGDGGALMGIADLETAVRLGLDMLVVVYDDAAYGAEVHHFGPDGHETDAVVFPDVDIAAIGRGFGAQGAVVRCLDDLQPVREWVAGGARGVFVLDAKVVPTLVADWLEEAFRGEH